jgi:hypothetical protein
MISEVTINPDGGGKIVDKVKPAPQKCAFCHRVGVFICDYPGPSKGASSCGKSMCLRHSKRVSHGVDFCIEHAP